MSTVMIILVAVVAVIVTAFYVVIAMLFYGLGMLGETVANAIFGSSSKRWATQILAIRAIFWPVVALVDVVIEHYYSLTNRNYR